MSWIPSPHAIAKETICVLAGAILAAFVMHNFPSLRDYVRQGLSLTSPN